MGDVRGSDRATRAGGEHRLESVFPWYDSYWLAAYLCAKTILHERHPERLAAFDDAMSVFRTDTEFRPVLLDQVFDADVMARIRTIIQEYTLNQYKLYELATFGRLLVHDEPYFLELQRGLVSMVSELVGEPVETSYNFLSLYEGSAVCPVHLDAPSAKWTLDICIDQSREWPLHFSQVMPWPETWTAPNDGAWSDAIKNSHAFESHSMKVGGAVIFGGSSQWHYRDPLPNATKQDFCTLLFFHFVPEGTAELRKPKNWARIFGVPELDECC